MGPRAVLEQDYSIAPSLKCEFRSWRESVRKCVHVCIYSSWARPCQPTSACPLQHGVGGRPQRPSNQPWTKPISRCPGASRTPTATSPEAPGELLEMPHDPARGAGVHSCTIWHIYGLRLARSSLLACAGANTACAQANCMNIQD